MSIGDPKLERNLILFAVIASDFDLDKAAKRLKGFGGKRRMVELLASWEADIANLERTTHDPQMRLKYRMWLANIRGTRQPVAGPENK